MRSLFTAARQVSRSRGHFSCNSPCLRCIITSNTEDATMYHYDPATALEELNDDAVLPNPVHLRDMMLRAHLDADHSLEYNRLFVDYQKRFGELQKVGRQLLEALGVPKK
jgi:hypothetical protein